MMMIMCGMVIESTSSPLSVTTNLILLLVVENYHCSVSFTAAVLGLHWIDSVVGCSQIRVGLSLARSFSSL